MGRKQKHPEHTQRAQQLMNSLLDEVVCLWTSEKAPELKAIAEEIEISPSKLRKLLITASVRDGVTYYSSPTADMVLKLRSEGKSVQGIQESLGLSYTSVQGYLPHSKIIYSLDTMSSEAERIRLYRKRKKTVEELNAHLGLPDASLYLWRTIIAFQGYPFTTSGRGSRPGIKFTYKVSKSGSAGGRHYQGETVEGYGNELWIIRSGQRAEKSISRSTVDLALRNVLEADGYVKGPKALNIPGAHSYIFAMLLRFGVIRKAEVTDG